MPRMLFTIILFSILFLIEFYSFQAIKAIGASSSVKWVWIALHVLAYAFVLYVYMTNPRGKGQTIVGQYGFGIFLTIFIPKILLVLTLFAEDIYRGVSYLISKINTEEKVAIESRRAFVSKLGLGLAAIPFSGFIYGILQGKYNYKVVKHRLAFENLPEAFDGFTITHISDIHSGSFTNPDKINYAVDLINEQASDVVLFTGDIVNNVAEEMDPWIETFSKISAPYGKYSVLGNHDYGEYMEWNSKDDKDRNFNNIKGIHPKIGFDLLLNESRVLEKDGAKIQLVGVENWGKGFKQVGDLNKASKDLHVEDFKILMSHDPSHWDAEIKKHEANYQLTLSGHTHGLQMGIEIPGWFKWSPVKYVYKQWAGLYKEKERYINVNRGFGYHAFPGRVGIYPEISVIELKKKAVASS